MKLISIFITVIIVSVYGFGEPDAIQEKNTGYNLSSPDKTIILPDQLREVSGITIIDSLTVALIQDEVGIIYIFDIRENRIKSQVFFAGKADYEDIALANKTIYVLTSDGTIFEISDYMSKNFKVAIYNTRIPSADNEGLLFDRINNRLLIGCKGDIKGDNFKHKRAIYSFDLKSKKLVQEPIYIFDIESLNKSINSKKGSSKDGKDKKGKKDNEKEIEIRISAIGIHPQTGKLFLLSAADNILCVANKTGNIENIQRLDKDLFLQPEGIAFFPNGDMLITNEARNKKPAMLRFNYYPDR
jgi:hypothetical protein